MQKNFKLSRVAASVALAITSLAATHSALAGSGFADVVLQGGATGRIGTYFAYSPSGQRVTNVPEDDALAIAGNRQPNFTGKALRKFIDPLPTHLGLTTMADGVTQKKVQVGQPAKWRNPMGQLTNDDYYEIALVEYTNKFHSDLRKASVQRGYVQIDHIASNSNGGSSLPGSASYPLTYPDGSPIMINQTDANGKMTGVKVQALAYDQPRFMGPILIASSTNPVSGVVNPGTTAKGAPIRLKFLNLLPAGRAELGPDVNGKAVVIKRNGDMFLPTDKYILGAGVGPDGVTEYTQNRADIHLHGGDTPWISDGTPHQWITPIEEADPSNTNSLAAEFANPANNRDPALLPHFLRGDSAVNVPDMYDPGPGAMTYYFPNGQTARFQWYHDHTFGATRLNVYAGMFAAYPIVDQTELDMTTAKPGTPEVVDPTTGAVITPAVPAVPAVLPEVGGPRYVPLLLQDRTFVPDDISLQDARWNTTAWGAPGDLWFPHVYETVQDPAQENNWNAVGRWHYGPWFWPVFPSLYALPTSEYSKLGEPNNVSTTPEAWMDTPIVNGTAYPTIEIEPEVYRFAVLNGTNDRVLSFNFFEARSTATLADGTQVTAKQPTGPLADGPLATVETEIDMVPAALPPTNETCAPGQTRPTPLGTVDANNQFVPTLDAYGKPKFCWPDTWPTDNRLGGVPNPAGVGPAVYQFASEGGWLPKLVKIEPTPLAYIQDTGRINVLNADASSVFLAPAERAEFVVDFSQYAGKTLLVYNDSGAPVPAGDPRNDLFTGVGDQSGSGGTEDTKPGYGPNIRTFMQIKVKALPTGATAPAAFDPVPLEKAVAKAYFATQERPGVAQAAFAGTDISDGTRVAGFDPAWKDLTPSQSYASIYVGSLKEPVFKYVPGVPEAGFNWIQVGNPGTGYVTAPQVTIAPPAIVKPGDQAATAKATLKIDAITVQTPGTGYTTAPLVRIVGGGGNGATATSTLAINTVTINPSFKGSYSTAPTGVKFSAPPLGGTLPVATLTTALVGTKYQVTGVTITTPGTGYTAAPLVSFTGGVGTAARATSSGGVGAVKITNPDPADLNSAGGGGYIDLSQTLVGFSGGAGTGAVAIARGKVFDITLTHPGSGYAAAESPTVTVAAPPVAAGPVANITATATAVGAAVGTGFAQASSLVKLKAIQELFDPTYGRLNATFGVELPFTSALTQTTIPLNYIDPITEQFSDGETQIWKITHNGVDTHPIHFHLMNVQLVNRVAWDGWIMPPKPTEMGWKETIQMNPLEDVIVAVRADKPTLPFGLPLSNRLMDPTQPVGSPFGFTQIDATTGFPATVVNNYADFAWEYVWHCHILGHEENDFMRAVRFDANEAVPTAPVLTPPLALVDVTANGVNLKWADTSATEYKFEVQRADVLVAGTPGMPAIPEVPATIDTPLIPGVPAVPAIPSTYSAFAPVGTAMANFDNFLDATATGSTASGATSVAYKVVAVGGYGAAASNVVEVSLVAGVPAAPTNLVATVLSDTTVKLDWTDGSANEISFLVERSLDGGNTWAPLSTLVANTVTTSDAALSANTTVFYRVSAVNIEGQSAYAQTSTTTLGAPAMASVTAVADTASQITVTWSAVAPAGNQTITSYTLTRSGGGALPVTTTETGTTFVHTGLTENTAYTYTVNAVNGTGASPVAGTTATTTATTQYLAAGQLLTVTATAISNTLVNVAWTGGTPSTSILIERCTPSLANAYCASPTSVWSVVNAADATVVASTDYTYRVTALNGPTNVSNTLTANVTTPGGVIVSAPVNLTAAANFALARVDLSWVDTAINETTFIVERSSDGTNYAQIGVAAPRNGSPATAGALGQTRNFSDSTVVAGTTYQYRVRAQNVTGAVVSDSSPSNVITVNYFLAAPSAVTGTIASTTRITVRWTDNAVGEAGFQVYGQLVGSLNPPVLLGTANAANNVGGLVSFNHNNGATLPLVQGNTYAYYVVANNGLVVSPASATVNVPFVAPALPAALGAVAARLPASTRSQVTLTLPAATPGITYTVQRIIPAGVQNAGTSTILTNTTLTTFVDTNLRRSATPYIYQIRANNGLSSAYVQTSVLVN